MDKEKYEFLIHHIFLPNKLPINNDENGSNVESYFLNLVEQTLNQDLNKNLIDSSIEYQEVQRMFNTWNRLQTSDFLDPNKIFDQINSLQENQSLALYLRSQNATILIKSLADDQTYSAIFSSFMANPKNENIMSVNGSLISKYPSFSCYMPNKSMLNSETFASILADLNNNPIEECMSHSRKAGTEVEEKRDVEDPKFVIEWLSAFVANDCPISNYPKSITKKVSNEISYNKGYMPFRRSGNLYT